MYRQLGASGINFFSYDGMTREGRTEAYLARVGAALFASPAPLPNWRLPVETAKKNADGGNATEPIPTTNERNTNNNGGQ